MNAGSAATVDDPLLSGDLVAHLDTQIGSAQRLLAIVLDQGAAIRARDVQAVVRQAGMLQAELQRRKVIEAERSRLLERAGARLGISGAAVTLGRLEAVVDAVSAHTARERSAELRGLLDEVQREHACNRALMNQELAFLDHLLSLVDEDSRGGYDAGGERPVATPSLVASAKRVLDLHA